MKELVVTNENYENVVANGDLVLVDFYADWCGPCKMLSPVISEIADEYEGKVVVGKINIDEQMELARKYNVSSIPTLAYFKNGQLVSKSVGVIGKDQILRNLGVN